MPTLFWDIETRSAASLRDCGAHVYSLDSMTQVLCIAYAIDDEDPQLWLPGDPPPTAFSAIGKLVAHNYDFERSIFKNILIPRHGFPHVPVEAWHCTQRLALANGYPAELDRLACALGLPYRKDPAARRAMLQVSRPRAIRKRKAGTIPLWNEDPAKLQLLYERCKLDVITTRAVWQSPKLKPLSEIERRYQLQDLIINERGVRLDCAFATAARDLAIHERIAIGLKLEELTGGTITSADQVKRFLEAINARGHNMTTLNKRTVAQVLANKPEDYVCQLLELRRTAARAGVRKYNRELAYASPIDDRMRGTLRIYGAGPGRWSGLGPQLQNLKKNEANLPLSIDPLSLLGDLSRAALCAVDRVRAGDREGIAQYGRGGLPAHVGGFLRRRVRRFSFVSRRAMET